MNNIIIGGIVSICGVIIGALISYFLSKKLVQQTHKNALRLLNITELNKATAKLRDAFSEELARLNPLNSVDGLDVHRYLEIAFPKHHAAGYWR